MKFYLRINFNFLSFMRNNYKITTFCLSILYCVLHKLLFYILVDIQFILTVVINQHIYTYKDTIK